MKYQTEVPTMLFPGAEAHEARRQRGEELAEQWIDGERGDVLKATKKSPPLLAAVVLSLVQADYLDDVVLLCERVIGIDKSDK
jgi:hypothetical protein